MTQRHTHHKGHASKHYHSKRPPRNSTYEVTKEEAVVEEQCVPPLAGPWSAWALDGDGRGFYYRNRISETGVIEWDFSPSSPYQDYRYLQPTQQIPRLQQQQPEASTFTYTFNYPTSAATSRSHPSAGSDFVHDLDGEDNIVAEESSIMIPAIIDVDTKNNIKVMVPNPKTGEATLIWDNKHKHSHKSKMSPNIKVRDWLHKN